jgi:intron-binding protein aquarius
VISIACLVNEQVRQETHSWAPFLATPEKVAPLLHRAMAALVGGDGPAPARSLVRAEAIALVHFFTHVFGALEYDAIRDAVKPALGIAIWTHLPPRRRDAVLAANPKLAKLWKKQAGAVDPLAASFLWRLLQLASEVALSLTAAPFPPGEVAFLARCLEFFVDLEAAALSRRFFNTLLDASHLLVHFSSAAVVRDAAAGTLLRQLLDMLRFYAGFEINDFTGEAMTENETVARHYDQIRDLQRLAFSSFRDDLHDLALSSAGTIDTRAALLSHLGDLDPVDLERLAQELGVVSPDTAPCVFSVAPSPL